MPGVIIRKKDDEDKEPEKEFKRILEILRNKLGFNLSYYCSDETVATFRYPIIDDKFTVKVGRDSAGKINYRAEIWYDTNKEIRSKEEHDKWLRSEPIKIKDKDITVKVGRSVYFSHISLEPFSLEYTELIGILYSNTQREVELVDSILEKPHYRGQIYEHLDETKVKELKEWRKLPLPERLEAYENKIRYIIFPHYKRLVVTVETHNPDYLINILRNYVRSYRSLRDDFETSIANEDEIRRALIKLVSESRPT